MSWGVEHTDEFEVWFRSCDDDVQEKITAAVEILSENGPSLGRPLVDTLYDSTYSNLKELRPTQTVRVFFAFDPTRTAILLTGGDKTGQKPRPWYKRMIRRADQLYGKHLERSDPHA